MEQARVIAMPQQPQPSVRPGHMERNWKAFELLRAYLKGDASDSVKEAIREAWAKMKKAAGDAGDAENRKSEAYLDWQNSIASLGALVVLKDYPANLFRDVLGDEDDFFYQVAEQFKLAAKEVGYNITAWNKHQMRDVLRLVDQTREGGAAASVTADRGQDPLEFLSAVFTTKPRPESYWALRKYSGYGDDDRPRNEMRSQMTDATREARRRHGRKPAAQASSSPSLEQQLEVAKTTRDKAFEENNLDTYDKAEAEVGRLETAIKERDAKKAAAPAKPEKTLEQRLATWEANKKTATTTEERRTVLREIESIKAAIKERDAAKAAEPAKQAATTGDTDASTTAPGQDEQLPEDVMLFLTERKNSSRRVKNVYNAWDAGKITTAQAIQDAREIQADMGLT